MIGKCPENTINNSQQKSLEAMCERRQSNDFIYTHLMDIPVLSMETNQTYANIYCARCHSDAENLVNWSVSIQCNEHLDPYNFKFHFFTFAQWIKFLIIFIRFDVSHDQMFSERNYMPGLRRWIQPLEATSIACDIIIEEFKDFKNYLKVKSQICPFLSYLANFNLWL